MSSNALRPDGRCFVEKGKAGERAPWPVRGAGSHPYGKQAVALRGTFQLAKARLNATFTVALT
jgi:hypothetical protein